MERRFWVLPFDKFKKLQKNKNKKWIYSQD
jgi:hypothetical protein